MKDIKRAKRRYEKQWRKALTFTAIVLWTIQRRQKLIGEIIGITNVLMGRYKP